MTKLTQIRKALRENPDIIIVGSPQKNFLPDLKGDIGHKIAFLVVPKNKYYTTSEIETFINSLIPGIKADHKNWYAEENGENSYGQLQFCEDIGTVTTKRSITLTDEDMSSCEDLVDGKIEIEQTVTIKRETLITLFPNLEIANFALNGGDTVIPYDSPLIVPLTKLKRLI